MDNIYPLWPPEMLEKALTAEGPVIKLPRKQSSCWPSQSCPL